MFGTLLVANRGEIACRIVRTARRLGVKTIAVYSSADKHALHVEMADEAWPLGPAPARESYLAADKIIAAALASGAEALHPGYGFLSENADFAQACADAGLCFVGPSPRAMQLMGSKASAKDIMQKAGVPVAPGFPIVGGAVATAAEALGFPLLIKACAGGGGRGMRVVNKASELSDAIEAAAREAIAAFGDGSLLVEKYLPEARHIEAQIFADRHGAALAFAERDCSLQRLHQKILEESPAPHLTRAMGRALRDAAVKAAKAVGYIGAGTVEFLVQGDCFYFLEMNTRLQVEHPVTEMISGQDLVEWQLRIASGEPLPLAQDQLGAKGAAIEARICAEDPSRGFMPSVGQIQHLSLPSESRSLRVDTGVRGGDLITPYYDSLIAKLIVRGEDRASAIRKLQDALDRCELVGVATNLDMLRALARHPAVTEGAYNTRFIADHFSELTATRAPGEAEETLVLAAGAAAWLADLRRHARAKEPWSPWAQRDGWRLDGAAPADIHLILNGEKRSLSILAPTAESFRLQLGSKAAEIEYARKGARMLLRIDGVQREVSVTARADGFTVVVNGRNHVLSFYAEEAQARREGATTRQLTAPLPARVTALRAAAGDIVRRGAPLILLEAMKMEIALVAPRDGAVERVCCSVGEMAKEGAVLLILSEESPA